MKTKEEEIALIKEQIKLSKQIIDLYELREKKTGQKEPKKKPLLLEIQDCEKELERLTSEKKKAVSNILNSNELTNVEAEMVNALRTNPLGREGNICDALFNDEGRQVIQSLIHKGIVKVIDHFHQFSYFPNNEHYGLVGEEYPTSDEEFSLYRMSSYSEKGSYTEFKQAKADGKILTDYTLDQASEAVDKLFKEKTGEKNCWINFCTDFLHINQLFYTLVDSGKEPEEILDILMIKRGNEDFHQLKLKSKWYLDIIKQNKKEQYEIQEEG